MRTRIGTQLIVGAGAVTALTVGALSVWILGTHRAALVAELHRSADQLSETIKSATLQDMLENRRDNIERQVGTIGRQEGIVAVRIYNKEGHIVFSSVAGEKGHAVDKRAEACYACHAENRPLERLPIRERARTFHAPDGGGHVLGIINPIHNQSSCIGACHAHRREDTVLGILDVTMSLAEVDHGIAVSQRRIALAAFAAVVLGGLILWWLNRRLVVRPVEALAAATRRVADGDLTTRVPVSANHELGDLARAFNEMTGRLAEDQRQLTQADKLASVGRLAAGVAHEINNPLTGVLTFSSLLLKRVQDDPDMRSDLEVVVRETKRCRDIVKGLLDFARQSPPHRQPTDLNEVVRRGVGIVTNQLALDHVALSLDLAANLPQVAADANQMQQVVVNLVVNAADAIEGGGSIRITTRREQRPPWGHALIRAAQCPRGCDLLDLTTRVRGLPSVRVMRTCRGREAPLNLDPVYGRLSHISREGCEEGHPAAFSCPRCHVTLIAPESRCERCGAEALGVSVPGHERVLWCTRSGCHWSHWGHEEQAGGQEVVELTVKDTGRGIAPEHLPHLFEPFFSTKGTRGTGLGLAVTWGIVEGHGGTIDVASESGQGSRFTVRLPLSEPG